MDSEQVIVERQESVVQLVINGPDRHNALDWKTLTLLHSCIEEMAADATVRVIILTGQGDRAFSSGVDLAGMGEGTSQRVLHESRAKVAALIQAMWAAPQPVIAKVRGYALAGGFGLAMAADVVLASESAIFGTPEAEVGLWPFQITVPLLRFAPPRVALELMLTTRRMDAAEALRYGLINRVVADEELDAAVDRFAAELAQLSSAATGFGKRSFYQVSGSMDREHFDYLATLLTLVNQFDDAKEGLLARREHRQPRFLGH
ncbi:enoyl-CoA hydratase/isomerase family protein [Ferrimicrobium sp.]|uniref:enoyl-CoA hydratase/isomerase family protein n=1 Tax=Ferrimicrobium sp. TaxID=2926050 RepID=UPI0026171E65|nr:enoyl-CoA hydratase/isomerase family protein [Ferrimicrobium sp.]